jgi:hypothetical protein
MRSSGSDFCVSAVPNSFAGSLNHCLSINLILHCYCREFEKEWSYDETPDPGCA